MTNHFRYKVGDRVRVIELGYAYTSYRHGASLLGLTNWKYKHEPIMENWQNYNPTMYEGTNKATIVSFTIHPENHDIKLYGLLMHDGTHFIISEDGIEPYKSIVKLDDSLFEV